MTTICGGMGVFGSDNESFLASPTSKMVSFMVMTRTLIVTTTVFAVHIIGKIMDGLCNVSV